MIDQYVMYDEHCEYGENRLYDQFRLYSELSVCGKQCVRDENRLCYLLSKLMSILLSI